MIIRLSAEFASLEEAKSIRERLTKLFPDLQSEIVSASSHYHLLIFHNHPKLSEITTALEQMY